MIDGIHSNDFSQNEVISLLSNLANRGITVDCMGEPSIFGGFQRVYASDRFAMLESKLRQAGSLAVIAPKESYTKEERGLVRRFTSDRRPDPKPTDQHVIGRGRSQLPTGFSLQPGGL